MKVHGGQSSQIPMKLTLTPTRFILSYLSHNCDSSALMKGPNSNQFAHLVCLCEHVSKTKELELAGKIKNQRVKSQRNVAGHSG